MQIIKRGKLFGHDWYFRLGKRIIVEGINSQVGESESVLFWEFDDKEYTTILQTMKDVAEDYSLPPIYILQASTNKSWHAVCLAKYPWLTALAIVASTPGIDPDFIRLAAYREHFTLRLTDKGNGQPQLKTIIHTDTPETVTLDDFLQGVRYGAWMREAGHRHA